MSERRGIASSISIQRHDSTKRPHALTKPTQQLNSFDKVIFILEYQLSNPPTRKLSCRRINVSRHGEWNRWHSSKLRHFILFFLSTTIFYTPNASNALHKQRGDKTKMRSAMMEYKFSLQCAIFLVCQDRKFPRYACPRCGDFLHDASAIMAWNETHDTAKSDTALISLLLACLDAVQMKLQVLLSFIKRK